MIKKMLLTCILFASSHCFSECWQEKWVEAASQLEQNEFEPAYMTLNEAIKMMEDEGSDRHPYVYVDRARLNILLGTLDTVLEDLEKALSNPMLPGFERVRALTTKIMVNGKLGDFTMLNVDLRDFKMLVELPEMELKDSKLISRNVPQSNYYKKLTTCYLIHSGICYDKGEFNWLKSGTLVAEKINHCGCQKCIAEYAKTRICDACQTEVSPTKENCTISELIEATIAYCGAHVTQLADQIACLKAVSLLKEHDQSIELKENTFHNIFRDVEKIPVYFD